VPCAGSRIVNRSLQPLCCFPSKLPQSGCGFRFGLRCCCRFPRAAALYRAGDGFTGCPVLPIHRLYRRDGLQVSLKSLYPRHRWLPACNELPRCMRAGLRAADAVVRVAPPAISVRLCRRCPEPVSQSRILSAVPTVRTSGCPVDGLSVSPMILLRLAPRCESSGSGW